MKNQKRKKRALVCYNCGGKGDPARLCPTPSDHAAHAVDEEGDTQEESSDEGDVCGVEWECELNGAGDEDDDILGMGCESTEQSKWERLTGVVDSGAAENVLPAGVCNHVKLSATRRCDAGIGFRGAGGERIRNHGQRKFKVRMRDGHVAGTTWQVADVKRPLMSVAKMVAAGNRVHLDSKDPRIVRLKGDVIPLRKAGNVFVVDLWVRKDATEAGFSPAGLSPEVCPTDDGQTIRPVRNEGLENATWLDLILEEWRMPKRNAKSDHMQRKSPTWIARVTEERMENVSGCCRSLAHHRKPSGNAMWCRTCRLENGADIVWPGGVSNVGIRGIRCAMTNIRLCALIMGI